MEKEIRSTIYLTEDLYLRFRQACTLKFGDKQGKVKQGIVLAITNFCDDVLVTPQDVIEDTEPLANSAKKLEVANVVKPMPPQLPTKSVAQELIEHEAEASVELDQDDKLLTMNPLSPKIQEDSVEAKAKRLAEERRKKDESEHKVLT